MKDHQQYMLRAIEIAKAGFGTTFPNPFVGAVIVHHNKIIGEGFTSPYGGSHAEVNAINSVKDTSILSKATIYVTLEPCSHHGKTPPCADLIIKHKIPEVVVGTLDPHDKVAGKGIKKLQDSGATVLVGVLENECKELHKRFLTYQQKKRPYILLKWAETNDGFIAPDENLRSETPEPFWITNSISKQKVHQLRSQEQAILVGTNTVVEDNPKLDVRHWKGVSPTRIVLDKDLKTPLNYHVFDGSIKTIILTEVKTPKKSLENTVYEVINFSENIAEQVCNLLYKHNILSVLIEGGTKTLQTFIDANLWDQATVFTGATNFKRGIKAPEFKGNLVRTETLKKDTLKTYTND